MDVEFEHGSHDPQTDVTHDDPIVTGKIALAHMKEFRTTTSDWSAWRSKPSATGARERPDLFVSEPLGNRPISGSPLPKRHEESCACSLVGRRIAAAASASGPYSAKSVHLSCAESERL